MNPNWQARLDAREEFYGEFVPYNQRTPIPFEDPTDRLRYYQAKRHETTMLKLHREALKSHWSFRKAVE